jgi:ribonucleoside-diphosphate reductase alpha chain
LPIDTIELLERERGVPVEMDRSCGMDWEPIRRLVAQHGMRNSNVMAIAPTATISTIVGVTQSIEPTYKHLFVKANLSGDFVQVNIDLVRELKGRSLWDEGMLEAIKYYDGSLGEIQQLPQDIKDRYATAFEVDPRFLIACASRRQKWIDMGQSLNLYISQSSGKMLDEMYRLAWRMGLKTTYYLRSLSATQVEKSTVDINKYSVQPRWMKSQSASADVVIQRSLEQQREVRQCAIDNPECEACQ